MRRTLIAGLLAGSLSGVGVVAVFADSDLEADLPPDKVAAINARGPATDVSEPGRKTASWREASPDSGPQPMLPRSSRP